MARPREVRDTFQTLIDQNNKVISGLETTMSRTADLRNAVDRTFQRQCESVAEQMMREIDRDALAKLASISGEKDIAVAYDEAVAASAAARKACDAYTAAHGSTVEINSKLQAATRELADTELKASVVKDGAAGVDQDLKSAKAFMKEYPGKQGLETADDVAYFSSKSGFKHYWALAFNGHYRNGRAVLREYEARGKSTVDLFISATDYVRQAADLATQSRGQQSTKDDLQRKYDEARRLLSLVQDESDIRHRMQKEIASQLRDKDTLNRAAILLPNYVGEMMVENWVKADACTRLEARLEGQKQGLKGVNNSLNKPMYNLNRAVSRGVTKDIRIDLQDTVAKVQTVQVASRHLATEAGKANTRIKEFSAKNPRTQLQAASAGMPVANTPRGALYDMSDMFTMYLIYSMIASDTTTALPAVDPAAVQMTLGIPDGAATAAGLDVGNLVPQLDASTLQSLESMGGGISIDTSNLDQLVGNIDVSVPDLGSIDVSVPDVSISVPDISVDTGGFGGGGGFDGGGFGGGGDF